MTSEKLEDSLSVAPPNESLLFRNRDKFDLIVMYDEESQTFGSSVSPMSIAVRVIYETEFRRMLRHPPAILIGGFKAWRSSYPTEITRDDAIKGLDFDMDRLKLAANVSNGISGSLADSSLQEPWSPSTQLRHSPFGMDQIPEDARFVYCYIGSQLCTCNFADAVSFRAPEFNGSTSSESVQRLKRKPTMSRPLSISHSLNNVSCPFRLGQVKAILMLDLTDPSIP